ncbi:MAG: ATP-dependent helicase HrpB [Bacteroidia bacterium]
MKKTDLPFNPFDIDLPVTEIIAEVQTQLNLGNTLLVNAPPGAGKSTLLPLALFEETWLQGKKIIMLEPRRLAAKTIAWRMASLLNEEVGQTVGYRIRMDTKVSKQTKIEVVTEGILTRMLHSDNALEEVGLVIFDEFHERNLQADLAMALCREAQQVLRPDLRILIMSATLNMPQLQQLLKAPLIESKGRQYPVDIIYAGEADETLLPEITARAVIKAVNENPGDALVFLPGEAEIKKCADILSSLLNDFKIHPLYGQLPQQEQHAAIFPNKQGKRKIVLATSIAETSLTIEGIKIVVDSGFARTSRFDVKSGLSRLETIRISKDAADQRAGRAGRLSAGVCYRLWTNATHNRLAEHRIPEIMEADLTSLLLDMAKWDVSDINQLTWLTPPPKALLNQASETLHQIAALEKNRITEHGKQIHQLACHPRIAHMLLKAETIEMKQLATDIAALLEERDPLPRDSGIDINLRIEALRRARNNNSSGNKFARIEKNAASYRKLLQIEVSNAVYDAYDAGLLLAFAYPERIASARPGNNAPFQLANGKIATAGHKDDLAHEPWLAVANMDLRDGLGKIFLAAPLNPKDLISMVREQDTIIWDTRKGGLLANKELKIGSIVLKCKPLLKPNEEQRIAAICKALEKEATSLLNINEKFTQLQNRILSLRLWNEQDAWADVTSDTLFANAQIWLAPYLTNVTEPEDLKRIDLAEALLSSLDYEKQTALQQLAPTTFEVPSGSKIAIEYFAHGAIPVLSVRLQEVFGLSNTPTLNHGKIKMNLHLLSPGYKPVQVTNDLKSFWDNLYHEIKKELQRRYPKHAWPDDPWTATAVAKGRSKK